MPTMGSTLVHTLAVLTVTLFSATTTVNAATAYANDFVDPDYILAGNFGEHTQRAQQTIVSWARDLAAGGPWTVMSKAHAPPSGNKHDYMSWAPYWWPNCTGIPNAASLSPQDTWKTCPYTQRDGQINPDVREVNDVGNFQDLSEAVLYNTIAWTFGGAGAEVFEQNAVRFLRAWFIDPETRMNPHLNFAQMRRGPDGQTGSRTGLIDLKGMAKITSAVLMLRKGQSKAWTSQLDGQLVEWAREYTRWVETAEIAIEESQAENNHGTFYFNQLAALKLLLNDLPGAKSATNRYFTNQFRQQITANGDQPFESDRTRPYHYRAYNLAAMITNARIEKYADPSSSPFTRQTSSGATIKTALDHALSIPASSSFESKYENELWPNIAAVASVYGDADGKYVGFVKRADADYFKSPYLVWNQPFGVNETAGSLRPTVRIWSSSASPTTKTGGIKAGAPGAASTATATARAGADPDAPDGAALGSFHASWAVFVVVGVMVNVCWFI